MQMSWRILFLLLMCPTLAGASERAFVSHTNYVVDPSFSHTIDNMPRIQSQGYGRQLLRLRSSGRSAEICLRH